MAEDLSGDLKVLVADVPAHVIGPTVRVDDKGDLEQQIICVVLLPHLSQIRSVSVSVSIAGCKPIVHQLPVQTVATPTAGPQVPDAAVVIAMATYNPEPEVIARQVRSIKAQSLTNWICLIQDDRSTESGMRAIVEAIGDDERFFIEVNEKNLGFYHNFERVLSRVPDTVEYVALSDQDDHWHPDKLERLVATLASHPAAQLAYSDLRVVDAGGRELSLTFAPGCASSREAPESILISNVVTGCATMFRRRLLESALAFPRVGTIGYHDHWLAYCASRTGGILYVPDALADYYQHGGNALGARDSDWIRLARVAALLLLSPIVAGLLSHPTARKALGRYARLILNQSIEEFAARVAFADTLQHRLTLMEDPQGLNSLHHRVSGQTNWILRYLIAGRHFGIGYTAVATRLCASFLIESWVRKGLALRARVVPRPTGPDAPND